MVFAWGWLPWESRNKSSLCQTIGELGVVKIVLSDKYLFFISFDKKLYSYNYIGDPQVFLSRFIFVVGSTFFI